MKITYFVHSITEDNEKSLATGWMQGKLSEEGVKRALALRPDLTSRDFDAVFCSDCSKILFDSSYDLLYRCEPGRNR
jgi:broad specificity phosphatase PhoE